MNMRMYAEADAALIERTGRDRQAFGAVYDLYVHRVYAFCLSRSHDHEEAEDLTSQTFERALGAIARYQHHGAPLSAWLLRIAANVVVDRVRQSKRTVGLDMDAPGTVDMAQTIEPDPEEWVDQWERAALLRSAMEMLPLDQQRALQLRFWEGYSIAEVAQRMDRNENAAKQLLHRAVQNLRVRAAEGAEINA